MHHPTDRITHTTAFVTPVVEHWLFSSDAAGGELDGVYVINSSPVHNASIIKL